MEEVWDEGLDSRGEFEEKEKKRDTTKPETGKPEPMGPAHRGATEDNAKGEEESHVVGVKRERVMWWERWQAKRVVESESGTVEEPGQCESRGGETSCEGHVEWITRENHAEVDRLRESQGGRQRGMEREKEMEMRESSRGKGRGEWCN